MRNVTRWAWIGLVMVAACNKVDASGAPDMDSDEEETLSVSDKQADISVERGKVPGMVTASPSIVAAPVRMAITGARSGQALLGQPIPLAGGEPEPVEEREMSIVDAPLRLVAPASARLSGKYLAGNRFAGLGSQPAPPPPPGTCDHNVVSQGGRVVAAPKVHRVFWGNYWNQATHTAEATRNDSTWTRLANSPSLFTRMSEYGIGAGSAGSRINISTGATGNVAESTFQSSLQSAIVSSGIVPGNNDIFVIFLPSGTASQLDIDNGYGGHHWHFSATIGGASRDVVYAIIDYYADANSVNVVTDHEIAEAATDPDAEGGPTGGYRDTVTGDEIGDLCEGTYRSVAGTLVQTQWSQKACRCVGPRDLNGMDYNGTGKPNATIFRSGQWWISGAPYYWNFGQAGDVPVPGDYDGDGRTELSLFRPATANYFVLDTTSGYYTPYYSFGQPGDIAVPADYDGDGKTDRAFFRPSNGTWYVVYSTTSQMQTQQWGQSGDVPIPADYDGDGKADMTVRRPGDTNWYVLLSGSPGSWAWATWGVASDKPVVGDFNGDGKADWAFYRPSEGRWYISPKDTGTAYTVDWGNNPADTPVPRDYDGDWKTDVAVWDPSSGTWYVVNSSTGTGSALQWGTNGDIPVMRMPQ